MKWIYLMLMIFLVACTTSTGDSALPDGLDDTPSQVREENVDEEVIQEEAMDDSADLMLLKQEVKLSDGLKVLPTNKKADSGNEVSFAMAATNPTNKNFSVMREITFKEAKDQTSNNLFAESDTMMTWLVSLPIRTFDVPAGDVTYDEISFKVGSKIGEEKALAKGTYVFVVTLYEGETISWDEPRVSDKQEISIRVN